MKKISTLLTFSFLLLTTYSFGQKYWIGGNGNWSDGAHWSNSSGGASCSCTPTTTDDVYFDANSFSANGQGVTIDATGSCDSMNWSGISHTNYITGTQDLHVYGSLTLKSTMTINYTGPFYFESSASGNKITSAGKSLTSDIYFNGPGDWTLQDAFTTSVNNVVHLTNGSLTTNSKNFSCGYFESNNNNTRALTLGTSTVTITNNSWYANGNNFALDAGTSLIKFTASSSTNSISLNAATNDSYYDILFQDAGTTYGQYIQGGTSFYHNITFNGNGNLSPAAGSTFNKVIFTGNSAINSNATFSKATFMKDGNIAGNNTLDSLIFSSGHNYVFNTANTQTINNYFQANGTCSSPISMSSTTNGTQSAMSVATGTVTVNYVRLKDMNATGGATFNANNSTDLGNNTGWNFTTPTAQTFYWRAGTGNWNDPNHWSLSSGGPAATCIPSPYDNVIFDVNSFSSNGQTVTMNATAYCDSMDWSACNKTVLLSGTNELHIFGSLKLVAGLNLTNYTGAVYFESQNSGSRITSAGKTFNSEIYFNGNGDWTLQDGFGTAAGNNIFLNFGILLTNGKSLTCGLFNSNNNNIRGLTLSTSTVTITANGTPWNIGGSNFALDAGTSLIKFTALTSVNYIGMQAGANDAYYDVLFNDASPTYVQAISGGISTYHNVTFNGTAQISMGNNSTVHKATCMNDANIFYSFTFDSLILSAGHNCVINSGNTETINNFLKADGTCSQPITIHTNNPGNQSTISKASGSVTLNYVNVQDMIATGGAIFTANNSVDFGNNTGWTFNFTSQNLYWIGGTGNWNDPNHWSTTSGGAAGTCIPTTHDNVFIDANSFSASGQSVNINVIAYCKNMTWSVTSSHPITGSANMNIYGSLTFSSGTIQNWTGWLYFMSSQAGNTITCAGKTFTSDIYFNGPGDWTLQDAFLTTGNIYHNNGTLITNGKNITTGTYNSTGSNVRQFTLSTSTVTITSTGGSWNVGGTNFALSSGTSLIKFTGTIGYTSLNAATNDVYYDVTFTDTTSTNGQYIQGGTSYYHNITFNAPGYLNSSGGSTFAKVNFMKNGNFYYNYTIDSLLFSAGNTYIFSQNSVQTINNYFKADGLCNQHIIMQTSSAGQQATISKSSGTIMLHYIDMKDMIGAGGATFNANNSVNAGNNTGWNFTTTALSANYTYSVNVQTVTFTNTSQSATNYLWNFGDGNTSTLQNPVHTFFYGGTYTVCLVASNACGTDSICKTIGVNCTKPVAGFTNSVSGLKVTFSNTSSNAATIHWDFGDATTSTLVNPTHTYYNSGTYTVCLVATNGCGTDSICKTISVTCSAPVASFSSGVSGMTVNFLNTSTNAANSLWKFGDTQSSLTNSPSHTYANPGTYTVMLTVSNGCGTDSTTQTVTITCSNPTSSFLISPQGLSVDFVSTSNSAATVQWDFGDGSPTSILPTVNHTYSTTGTYTVCLTASNGCGNDVSCKVVSVCANPVANFTASSSAFNATFTNSSTNGITYFWSFGDGYASSLTSPAHTYSVSGMMNVCLIASNDCGSDTLCKSVSIVCTPFTSQNICMVTVDSTSTHNVLVWNKPTTTSIDSFRIYREISSVFTKIAAVPYSAFSEYTDTSAGINPNVTYYKYKMTLIDTCGNESALSAFHQTIHLSVSKANPPASFNLSWNDYIGFTVPQYRILRDSMNTGWKAVDSVSFSTLAWTDIHSYPPTDTIAYAIEVVLPSACTPSIKNPDPLATNLNSSKSNVYRAVDSVATAVQNFSEDETILVYPNPSSGIFTIDISKINSSVGASGQAAVRVFNMMGEEVEKIYSNGTNRITMNLSKYAKGVYYVQISSAHTMVTKKIIIE